MSQLLLTFFVITISIYLFTLFDTNSNNILISSNEALSFFQSFLLVPVIIIIGFVLDNDIFSYPDLNYTERKLFLEKRMKYKNSNFSLKEKCKISTYLPYIIAINLEFLIFLSIVSFLFLFLLIEGNNNSIKINMFIIASITAFIAFLFKSKDKYYYNIKKQLMK